MPVKPNPEKEKRDPSRLAFSVKVMRPQEKYPYEHTVWESELSVPVGFSDRQEDIQSITDAWIEMMATGLKVSKVYARMSPGVKDG